MKYKVGSYYRYRNLKFRVLHIDNNQIYIRFAGNITPDKESSFDLGSDVDKVVVPLPAIDIVEEGRCKRYLKEAVLCQQNY